VVLAPERESALWQCPPDHQVLDVDLCKGTKKRGYFAYLCYERGFDIGEAIGDIMLECFDQWRSETSITKLHHGETKQFTRIDSDLNRGARGKFVFVSYSHQAPPGCLPITSVHAVIGDKIPPPPSPRWEYVTWQGSPILADANKGAGGPFIFISVKRGEIVLGKQYHDAFFVSRHISLNSGQSVYSVLSQLLSGSCTDIV
jgi:hypothetical protein